MSDGEVEALKARLAGLGVQLSAASPSPSRPYSASPGTTRHNARDFGASVESPFNHLMLPASPRSAPRNTLHTTPSRPGTRHRSPGVRSSAGYDSEGSVDVSELLERCTRVEDVLSASRSAAKDAGDAETLRSTALSMGKTSPESLNMSRISPAKARAKSARKTRPKAPGQTLLVRKAQPAMRTDPNFHKTPLASVLDQYRAAETNWAQEKAKLRRELIEQRKRANKFENDYKKLVNQFDSRAVDIKSMKGALKNRDVQLHQLTIKLRETEDSLQRCNETAAEELASLTEERDDLKSLLQATLMRLESVDEVLHRADVSTAMMEQKVKALDQERLKAVNMAAVARAEADTMAKSQSKLQWQSKAQLWLQLLERMSELQITSAKTRGAAMRQAARETSAYDSDDSSVI